MTLLRTRLPAVLALVAFLLAAVAQFAHVSRDANVAAVILFAVALLCWIVALTQSAVSIETRTSVSAGQKTRTRETALTPVVSAIGLALLTFLFGSANGFNSDNVPAWLGSSVLFLYAFWQPEKTLVDWRAWLQTRVAARRDLYANGIRISLPSLLLIGVLLLGVFFYFHDLDRVPAELDSPHAEMIIQVNQVLDGARPIYVERGMGHGPFDYYVTAAFVALSEHPLDFMALKVVNAALGVLLVLGVFLLARELFDFQVALAAAALVAIGKWPLALARDGLGYSFAPLAVVLTFYFLLRALKFQRRNDFLMTGLCLGLGLYGFDVFQIAPVLVVVCLVGGYLVSERSQRPRVAPYLRNIGFLFALALIVAMPIVRYAIDQPAIYWRDTLTRVLGDGQPFTGNPVALLAANLWNAVWMFNWTGDGGWTVNVPGDAALDYVTGALFLLGLAYAIFRLTRHREKAYAFVLIGLALMLLPSALSLAKPDENPSATYASGAIPFVFMLAALALVWVARMTARVTAHTAWSKLVAAGIALTLFAAAALANYTRYFDDFGLTYEQSTWNSSEIALAIRGFADSVGDAQHAWIMAYPNWVDARTVGINLGQVGWEQTLPNADAALQQTGDNAPRIYVLSAQDRDNLARLQGIFPNGQVRANPGPTPEQDWLLFIVPGNVTPSVLNP